MKNTIKKIAVFRALYLGDMLCIIPAVRALRKAFPKAEITLVGLPWQENFVSRFPNYFNSFIKFPGWPGLPEQRQDAERQQEFLAEIRKEQFDLILQMQGNGEVTNKMCALWEGKIVTGLRRKDEYGPDEKLFPVSEDSDHEVLRFLKLIDALEISRQGCELEFPLTAEDHDGFFRIADALKIASSNYICLHPGARDERRRWSSSHFAHVGDALASKGYTIVLTGSESEQELLGEVENRMMHPAINTIERLQQVSLGELAALIKHSQLLISNDTGVSHIAAGLQVPSVVIFSPYSDIRRWAPLDKKLHCIISPEESSDPEFVVQHGLHQLQLYASRGSISASSQLETIR